MKKRIEIAFNILWIPLYNGMVNIRREESERGNYKKKNRKARQ